MLQTENYNQLFLHWKVTQGRGLIGDKNGIFMLKKYVCKHYKKTHRQT